MPGTFRLVLIEPHELIRAAAKLTKEADKTDHGPEVVSHLLSVLKDGPEKEIPPRMFAALL